MSAVRPEEIAHPQLRLLLEGLYALAAAGEPPTLDQLRTRLEDPDLVRGTLRLQEIGRSFPDRVTLLRQLLTYFAERRTRPVKQEIRNQLHAASDHEAALALLRQLAEPKQ